jgi:hypothetical protein
MCKGTIDIIDRGKDGTLGMMLLVMLVTAQVMMTAMMNTTTMVELGALEWLFAISPKDSWEVLKNPEQTRRNSKKTEENQRNPNKPEEAQRFSERSSWGHPGVITKRNGHGHWA